MKAVDQARSNTVGHLPYDIPTDTALLLRGRGAS